MVDQTAAQQSVAVNPEAADITANAGKAWLAAGGELHRSASRTSRPRCCKLLASVGADVSKTKPELSGAYKIVSEAAQRTK